MQSGGREREYMRATNQIVLKKRRIVIGIKEQNQIKEIQKITEWLQVKKIRTDIADLNESENDEENEDSRDNMSIDKNIQRIPNPFTKNNK